jgi:hypothetical protein
MRERGYRPAGLLVTTVSILLIAHAVVCLSALPRDLDVIESYERTVDREPGGSWVDAYIVPAGFAQALVKLALIVLFCVWIPLANSNARALGATGMRFTPAGSVGWYLVPVMNLYKPYQAMREIWLASLPDTAREHARAPLLGWWWALFLVSAATTLLVFRLVMAGGRDACAVAARAHLLLDVVDIPLALVTMLLVIRIHSMQERRRSAAVPE